ncbi:MAG: response regulator [Patescibacteria group bacterium]
MAEQKKIFLIEDEVFIRDLYKKILTDAGYAVKTANDGEEALEVLKTDEVFDLILLDIMLPKLTGLEVLRALREGEASVGNTPIYLLTNLGEDNIINEAYRLGADGYLLKAKYLPRQLVEEIDKFFVKSTGAGIVDLSASSE